ncbi:MAG: twin-arginine translocase TatA/TatE family subunit [Halanaeroarchaeum sp.]
MIETLPLFVGGVPGGMELAVILLIAVLLFGANKIPKLARSTGQAMGEFQKGREEVEQELEEIRDGPGSADTGTTDGGSSTTETSSSDTESESESTKE